VIVLRLFTGRRFLLFLTAVGVLVVAALATRFTTNTKIGALFTAREAVQKVTPGSATYGGRPFSHLIRGCFTSDFDLSLEAALRRTPIISAALIQDWRSVDGYIRNGAGVESADANGVSPLMVAARFGKLDVIDALLRGLANPLATDIAGHPALYYAVTARHGEAVDMLLARTPVAYLPTTAARDIVDAAFATGDWRVVQPVISRFPPAPAWSPAALAMLSNALAARNTSNVQLMMARHQVPPPVPGSNVPMIAHAIVDGDTALSEILLRCGADPNTTLPTPLDKRLLARLPSTFLRSYIEGDSGVTILMVAAGLGNESAVKSLLAAGANRNLMTTHYKMLALYFAARSPSYRSSQLLLGSGLPPEQLRIEITLGKQSAVVIKDGAPILTTICSTGRDGFSTQPGNYVITDKDRNHRSTIYKVPMPYFMRLNCRDFGMHEGNVSSPHASHGCIRLPGDVARRLFSEIPVGTVVKIN